MKNFYSQLLRFSIVFGLFVCFNQLHAQTYFIKSLEINTSTDKLFGNQILSNGDYILSGHTSSDILIVRSDSLGNILWQKTYPSTADSEEGKTCAITGTGNIVVAGYSKPSNGTFDAMVVNTDANGTLQWIKKYGHPLYHTKAWPVDTSFLGTLYLAGWTSDSPSSKTSTWTSGFILKTNAVGDTIWTRRYGNEVTGNHTYFRSLAATNDGGCIAVGETNEYGAGGYDVLAVKLNSNGDTLWTKTLGSSGDDYGWNVKQTSDNGYIICGNTGSFSYSTNRGDMLIIRLNSSGNILWTKTIGDATAANTLDAARCITETSDNNFILCGYSGVPGKMPIADEDGVVIKINGLNGDTLWTKKYPLGIDNEHFRFINEINSGDYLVSGYSNSLITGVDSTDDIVFLKIQEYGFAGGCYETSISPTFQVNNQSLQTYSGIPSYPTGFVVSNMSNSGTTTFTENMLCDSNLTTGIENNITNDLVHYPNPTADKLTILLPNNSNFKELIIFNLLGEIISTVELSTNGDQLKVNLSNLHSGIYFFSLTFESGKTEVIKVIKE